MKTPTKPQAPPADHPWHDFRNFIYSVWMHLGLPEPTPVQYDVAYYLQHGPKRSIIEGYRGMGKSYITSAFACWNWWKDPDCRIMVVSGGKDRADAFSRFCLRLLQDMPQLQHVAPRKDQLKALHAFEVNGARPDHSPSCKSVGITGQLTGSRADIIIGDDVETPKNTLTVTQREKLETLVTEFDAVIKPDNQSDIAKIVYLGTPQVEDTLYNKLRTKGYDLKVWPARKPSMRDQEEKYAGTISEMVMEMDIPVGAPVDPLRFDEHDLLERELSYGKTGFALQFMLDTSLEDALKYPLKCSDFVVMDIDRDMAPVKIAYGSAEDQLLSIDCGGLKGDRWFGPLYVSESFEEFESSVLVVDPSGRGKDRTGYCVMKSLNGMLFVRRLGGLPGGYDTDTLESLAHIARAERVNLVRVEANFGDGMYTQMIKPVMERIYPCTVEEYRVTQQKELRIIDTCEPLLNAHRIVIDPAVIRNDLLEDTPHSFQYQLSRLTKERQCLQHDDSLDAFAGACAYFTEKLNLSIEDAEERYLEEQKQKAIDEFMEAAGARRSRGRPNWTDRV